MALWVLIGIGIALRAATWLAYQPVVVNFHDMGAYIAMAQGELFSDPTKTAGYPLLLRGLHAISDEIELTIAVQHLLGIAASVLLYATVRRIGAPSWAGLAAAAAVLLPIDQIALEHAIMTDGPFTFGVAAVLYASVRALDAPRVLRAPVTTRHVWLAVAGGALGLSAWVRPVAAPLIPFLAVWVAFAVPGRWWVRVGHAALASAAAASMLLVYFDLNASATGNFGLTQSTGWALYARTAPVAECAQFDPPPGTSGLCEARPPAERPGPDFYGWFGGPARELYGAQPNGNDELRAFALEVIKHQPVAYAETVVIDILRYFLPLEPRDPWWGGPGYDAMDIEPDDPQLAEGLAAANAAAIKTYYPDEDPTVHDAVEALGELQDWLRIHALLLLVAAISSSIGLVLARGRVRAGLALLLGVGLLLLIVPAATVVYAARYTLPAVGPLVGSGAIALWLIGSRFVERRRRGVPSVVPAERR